MLPQRLQFFSEHTGWFRWASPSGDYTANCVLSYLSSLKHGSRLGSLHKSGAPGRLHCLLSLWIAQWVPLTPPRWHLSRMLLTSSPGMSANPFPPSCLAAVPVTLTFSSPNLFLNLCNSRFHAINGLLTPVLGDHLRNSSYKEWSHTEHTTVNWNTLSGHFLNQQISSVSHLIQELLTHQSCNLRFEARLKN